MDDWACLLAKASYMYWAESEGSQTRDRMGTNTSSHEHRASPEDRDPPQHTMMQSPRLNKSCDQCRNRKVRCIGMPYVYHVPSAQLLPVQRSPCAVPSTSPGRPVACTHCIVSLPNNHCRDGHLTVNRNETRRVSSAT